MKTLQGRKGIVFYVNLTCKVGLSKFERSLGLQGLCHILSFSFSTDKRCSECAGQSTAGDFSLLETFKPPSSSDKLAKSTEERAEEQLDAGERKGKCCP